MREQQNKLKSQQQVQISTQKSWYTATNPTQDKTSQLNTTDLLRMTPRLKIETKQQFTPPRMDSTEKILSYNPGNKVRNKAIAVDLGDYEQLRLQLEDEGHTKKLQQLFYRGVKKQQGNKHSPVTSPTLNKNIEQLMTMTMQEKNQNPNISAKNCQKSQSIRKFC